MDKINYKHKKRTERISATLLHKAGEARGEGQAHRVRTQKAGNSSREKFAASLINVMKMQG